MKKLEIIIESVGLKTVIKNLEILSVNGYTVIENIYGKGKSGYRHGDELTNVLKNALVIVVDTEEKTTQIINELRSHLKTYSGKMILTDAEIIS